MIFTRKVDGAILDPMLLLVVSPQAKGIRNISKFRLYLLLFMQQINTICNNNNNLENIVIFIENCLTTTILHYFFKVQESFHFLTMPRYPRGFFLLVRQYSEK